MEIFKILKMLDKLAFFYQRFGCVGCCVVSIIAIIIVILSVIYLPSN